MHLHTTAKIFTLSKSQIQNNFFLTASMKQALDYDLTLTVLLLNFERFYWQVVWKGTTKLGCAIQKRGRETYVVARYSPPGNVIGTFAKNVGRKVHVC